MFPFVKRQHLLMTHRLTCNFLCSRLFLCNLSVHLVNVMSPRASFSLKRHIVCAECRTALWSMSGFFPQAMTELKIRCEVLIIRTTSVGWIRSLALFVLLFTITVSVKLCGQFMQLYSAQTTRKPHLLPNINFLRCQ